MTACKQAGKLIEGLGARGSSILPSLPKNINTKNQLTMDTSKFDWLKPSEELEDMPDFEAEAQAQAEAQEIAPASDETTETDTESEESDKTAESKETEESKPAKKEEKLSPYEEVILAEMKRRADAGDTLLATAMQSKDKNIKECFEYVTAQAKKKATGNCAMIEDAVVYGWAHHYYIEPKETIDKELHPAPKKVDTATAKKTEPKKKTFVNPLLASLAKKGYKQTDNGTMSKTTATKDGSKTITKDKKGNTTTTIEKNGQKYTLTEFSLF